MARGTATRRAMNAHTDLNLFDAVLTLTESHFRGDRFTVAAAAKMRAICKQQCQRLLRIMDEAEAECDRALSAAQRASTEGREDG